MSRGWVDRVPAWWPPAVLALALAAGWTLLDELTGVGMALLFALAFASVAAAAPPHDAWSRVWWGFAIALALVPAVRGGGWVSDWAVQGAVVMAALAAGGFTTLAGAFVAVARAVASLLPGPFVAVTALVARAEGRWGRAVPAARGVALAAVVLTPFVALFATADAAFGEWVQSAGRLAPDVDEDVPARLFIALGVLTLAGTLLHAALRPGERKGSDPFLSRVRTVEWVIVLGALVALFVAFVGLQLASLFGGHDFVARTAGLTYAEYAREGFGQLVAAAVLTLAVIGAARAFTVRETPAQERLQRILLGVLCLLTLVVLASAWRRLGLYVEAFGQSRDRVAAHDLILWLGAVFVLVLAAGAVRSAGWLPRAAVALSALALLAFALSNPDARVAERNVERHAQTGKIDPYTLTGLGPGAVPAVLELPPGVAACAVPAAERPGSAVAWSVDRARARRALRDVDLPAVNCW